MEYEKANKKNSSYSLDCSCGYNTILKAKIEIHTSSPYQMIYTQKLAWTAYPTHFLFNRTLLE